MAKTLDERLEQSENIRDALLDRLEGRSNQNHNSYSIGDRSIAKMTIAEIRIEYDNFDRQVRRLAREKRRAEGCAGHIRMKF